MPLAFRFHKGTIRTRKETAPVAAEIDFNSIKVQLEPTLIVTSFGVSIFQFHKGTIRTRLHHFLPGFLPISIP